jgi:hypothetical protein
MAYTTIDDPALYFNVISYTGAGGTQAITGVGFQPDFVWIHDRAVGWGATTYDAVRGANKVLVPHDTGVEDAAETQTYGYLSAFGSDGFTVAEGTSNGRYTNYSSQTYISFNWRAGTTSGIAGSPSITPLGYSFNATSGFSIIKYNGNYTSGATLPHGLGVAPKMMIVKNLDTGVSWGVYHKSIGATHYLYLDTAIAAVDASTRWNDTDPGAQLFTIGNTDIVNTDADDYIAYCFAPVQGYSKFGGFIGNGNVDGTFVYLGFRPAFVMIKCATRSGTDIWVMYDNKRGQNVISNALSADTPAAERSSADIDFLSNGFKTRIATTDVNPSGETAIYMAFAESPFVNSNGVPNNAR